MAPVWTSLVRPVPVLTRTDVSLRVQRVATERTWRAPRSHHALRSTGKRARICRGEPDAQHVAGELRRLGRLLLALRHRRLRFDQHTLTVAVPSQGESADPELLLDRG